MTVAGAKAQLRLRAAQVAFYAKPGRAGDLDRAFAAHDKAVEDLIEAAQAYGAMMAAEAASRLLAVTNGATVTGHA